MTIEKEHSPMGEEIIRILAESDRPLTVEEIQEQMEMDTNDAGVSDYTEFKIKMADKMGYVCSCCGCEFVTYEDINLDIANEEVCGVLCNECNCITEMIANHGLDAVFMGVNYVENLLDEMEESDE